MTIKEIFDSMAYGPAPESASEALAWIAKHNGTFGHYIDGAFTKPGDSFTTSNPATGKPLAQVTQGTEADVAAAVKAARRAQPGWAKLPAHKRAQYLYALARLTQKHARLLAVLETLDNGKPIRDTGVNPRPQRACRRRSHEIPGRHTITITHDRHGGCAGMLLERQHDA
jgi:aldehyde dehydrogenase (NAD+)